MAIQGAFNTQLSKALGRVEATAVVQATGLVAAGLLLLALRSEGADWRKLAAAPWYTLLGGVIGVGIVFAVVGAMTRLGLAGATTAILVAQILTAALVDHFGLFGAERILFGGKGLLGAALLAAGSWLLLS
jgi:transporter family-2 protein